MRSWRLGPFRFESLREAGQDALIIDDPQIADVVADLLFTSWRRRLKHCKQSDEIVWPIR